MSFSKLLLKLNHKQNKYINKSLSVNNHLNSNASLRKLLIRVKTRLQNKIK